MTPVRLLRDGGTALFFEEGEALLVYGDGFEGVGVLREGGATWASRRTMSASRLWRQLKK